MGVLRILLQKCEGVGRRRGPTASTQWLPAFSRVNILRPHISLLHKKCPKKCSKKFQKKFPKRVFQKNVPKNVNQVSLSVTKWLYLWLHFSRHSSIFAITLCKKKEKRNKLQSEQGCLKDIGTLRHISAGLTCCCVRIYLCYSKWLCSSALLVLSSVVMRLGWVKKQKSEFGGSVMVGYKKDVLGRGYVLTYDNCCVWMSCIDTVEASQS